MAGASCQPVPTPGGLLLSHDWRHTHTSLGLLDTTITNIDRAGEEDFQTLTFPITSVSQLESFVSGHLMCDDQSAQGCPLLLVPDSHTSCDFSDRQLVAVVRVNYVFVSQCQSDSLSDGAIIALQDVEDESFEPDCTISNTVEKFLLKFGSHCRRGSQKLGSCFSLMVVLDTQVTDDDTTILEEIAEEIFAICDNHQEQICGSSEGVWYNPQHLLNTASWSANKKKVLGHVKLRVAHSGRSEQVQSLEEWKNNQNRSHLVTLGTVGNQTVSVWEMILGAQMEFQKHKRLAAIVKDSWKSLVSRSQHQGVDIPCHPPHIDIPVLTYHYWEFLKEELGMEQFFPCKLTTQTARSLRVNQDKPVGKQDLPWQMLEQLIRQKTECRDKYAYEFAQTIHDQTSNVTMTETTETDAIMVPHSMDMLLLLFSCSDFHLRQIFALSLYACRLAIPFIVPTADGEAEVLLWPLRSIVMEWRNQDQEELQESLVQSMCHRVAFMRFGKSTFSKSKLLNDVLSAEAHAGFFNQDAQCENKKRLISNGTTEMTPFLPANSRQDPFTVPVLFFNLRGDALEYPVQRDVLLDLTTSLVVFVDMEGVQNQPVQQGLQETITKKTAQVIIVLTCKTHHVQDAEKAQDVIRDLIGDGVTVITAQEMNDSEKCVAMVSKQVRESLNDKMILRPGVSLEDFFAESPLLPQCTVDEKSVNCSTGKIKAEELLAEMLQCPDPKRKENLTKGEKRLRELGTLVKKLYRSSEKEKVKQAIRDVRKKQIEESKSPCMPNVIRLLWEKTSPSTRSFAVRWIQLKIQSDLMKDHGPETVPASLSRISEESDREKNLAMADWEHCMRELSQLYESALNLKMEQNTPVSCLPDIAGGQLLAGNPVELMDGDHGLLPTEWIKAVFKVVTDVVGKDKKIFVLSFLGVQGSGTSTLLTTLFGLCYVQSVGRSTRGIYAQLLAVAADSHLAFHYILILDACGLKTCKAKSHGTQDGEGNEYDSELATVAIRLADLVIINTKGELLNEIADVLEIVVLAFFRMKEVDGSRKRRCIFVRQDVDTSPDKTPTDQQKLQDELDGMTKRNSEVLGLSEAVTSFNRLIEFDSKHDVLYLPSLQQGQASLSAMKTSHHIKATQARNKIVDEAIKFPVCIALSDFSSRVEDTWNDVLADDFVFSFKNSLAAKAYILLERHLADLTLSIEQNVLCWVNNACKTQVENCETEDDVYQCYTGMTQHLDAKLSELLTQKRENLVTYIDRYAPGENQWKAEKSEVLQRFARELKPLTERDLEKMTSGKLFDLQCRHTLQSHKQKIIDQVIHIAERIRAQSPSDEELEDQFRELWDGWSVELKAIPSQLTQTLPQFENIILEKMGSDGLKYFKDQLKLTPLKACVPPLHHITSEDIREDHILLKDEHCSGKGNVLSDRSSFLAQAAEKATSIMTTVMTEVENISREDVMFNQLHGKQIIDLTIQGITKHNDLPCDEAKFVFTPQFRAMLAIRVACSAAPQFDEMNQCFESKHGIHAQIEAYRARVLRFFINTVKQASAEATASEDFCETIKVKVLDKVRLQLKQCAQEEMYRSVGTTKYDLIVKMLTEIAETERFEDLYSYVCTPYEFAKVWIQKFGERLMFAPANAASKYNEQACLITEQMLSQITSSISSAKASVTDVPDLQQYNAWITEFCKKTNASLPLDPHQLSVSSTCNVQYLDMFLQFLQTDLKKLEAVMKQEFSQVTAATVSWPQESSPFVQMCNRLWGCTEHCPLCREPCQMTDPKHESSHCCIQHRPLGVAGVVTNFNQHLVLETCSILVAGDKRFGCSVTGNLCQRSGHCTGSMHNDEYHPCREYKKFLPLWDIAPDPSGEASKFWQWAMCTFRTELLNKHEETFLEIPDSWKEATKQEAIDSLNVFL